jgi:hypothetical protein
MGEEERLTEVREGRKRCDLSDDGNGKGSTERRDDVPRCQPCMFSTDPERSCIPDR